MNFRKTQDCFTKNSRNFEERLNSEFIRGLTKRLLAKRELQEKWPLMFFFGGGMIWPKDSLVLIQPWSNESFGKITKPIKPDFPKN